MIQLYCPISCFLVVLAVDDVASVEEAITILNYLTEEGYTKSTAVIVVANKIDLVRSRVISEQGKNIIVCVLSN